MLEAEAAGGVEEDGAAVARDVDHRELVHELRLEEKRRVEDDAAYPDEREALCTRRMNWRTRA